MYRGIKGTYIYAWDDNLRDYLKQHIPGFKKPLPFKILNFEDVKPYVNAVPLVDIAAAAGSFSELQMHKELEWVELPFHITPRKGYFVCQVVGESMNKHIPNGSYCLFKKDEGGSRNGKIVLVESTHVNDKEFGSNYTIKEYSSKKAIAEDGWQHQEITLFPKSYDNSYRPIVLRDEECLDLRVVGAFVKVLS